MIQIRQLLSQYIDNFLFNYFPGIPSHDLPGTVSHRSYVPLSWTLPEFNNYICQSFPTVSLNVIGFHLARADNSRVLTKIQANTLNELKTAAGRSRVYIIPQTNIILPLEVSFYCCFEPTLLLNMRRLILITNQAVCFVHQDLRT